MVRTVEHNGNILAIIIPADFREDGVRFFTPDQFSQQLAFMKHPKGHEIQPHVHCSVPREVQYTQEVLVIRRGKLRVDFYDGEEYLESRKLGPGDVILLASGGHGFKVLEELEMIEVKQGPYGGEDKVRFTSVCEDKILLKD